MAGTGVPFRVLRWFPARPPGGPCSPEKAAALTQARREAYAQAVLDRVARVPQPGDPPAGPPQDPDDPLVAYLQAARGADVQRVSEGGGSSEMIDAIYDAAIIGNLSAFALGASAKASVITPGTAALVADNQGSNRPLYVRVKAATDGSGVATNLYIGGNASEAGASTAPVGIYAVAPSYEFVLVGSGSGQVWVDGTAPPGASTFTVMVVSFQLKGRATVYP